MDYYKQYSDVEQKIIKSITNNLPQYIYHYTSPIGLMGILQSKKLWCTRSDYLNDRTELLYAYEVVSEVIEENIFSLDFKLFFKERFLGGFEEDQADKRRKSHYICSFSSAKDELGLWNYYTKSIDHAGYNIGFVSSDLSNSINEKNTHPFEKKTFGKVIYDPKEQKELLRELMIPLSKYYDQNQIAKINHNYRLLLTSEIMHDISNFLYTLALFFKHPAYKHEEEYRIISAYNSNNKRMVNNDRYKITIKNGFFFPYNELSFDENSICSICASPYIKSKKIIESIQLLYYSCGYDADINCDQSKLPVEY